MTKPANLRARRERTEPKALTWADTPARITPETKVTILPSAPVYARHQIAPGTPVRGCGFAEAGMGIDIVTGRPWVSKRTALQCAARGCDGCSVCKPEPKT